MSETEEETLLKTLSRGGQRKPIGYSFLTKKCDLVDRKRIIRYLSGCREALIHDLGGSEILSAQEMILVDRLISLLGVVRGIEEYHQEDIMNTDGSLKTALTRNYLAYINSIRLILVNLGLERRDLKALSAMDYIQRLDNDKETPDKPVEHHGDGHE